MVYARKLAKSGSVWSKGIRVSGQPSFGNLSSDMHPEVAVSQRGPYAIWTDWRGRTVSKSDVYGSGILSGINCP